ncbi:hypothetical protein HK102_010402, partial [Quaeritorhiza haematococci]
MNTSPWVLACLFILPQLVASIPTPAPQEQLTPSNEIQESAGIEGGDKCAEASTGDYDHHMHVASIFIIMALSFVGTMLPLAAKRMSFFKINDMIFQYLKLFGAGVILATAFVHMYTPAVENLTNPCLPEPFQSYPAWASAIALMGVMFTHCIQVLAGIAIRKSVNSHIQSAGGDSTGSGSTPPAVTGDALTSANDINSGDGGSHDSSELTVAHHHHHHHHDHDRKSHDNHTHSVIAVAEKHATTYILEAGIASHSIIIGITLGASRSEFPSLLIALLFHQFFEGLALSSVVLEADFKRHLTSILMVTFYTLTTPLGIAIGIALHDTYAADNSATMTLILLGVLDAVSAGILMYDALVNMVVPHFGG